LFRLDTNNSFDYEILSSMKKADTCSINGVVKAEESCSEKEDKIKNFFDKSLKTAIIEAFGYDPDFTDKYAFDVSVVIGRTKEVHLSPDAQEYFPRIWKNINWAAIKQKDDGVNDKIISKLTKELDEIEMEKAKGTEMRKVTSHSTNGFDEGPLAPNSILSTSSPMDLKKEKMREFLKDYLMDNDDLELDENTQTIMEVINNLNQEKIVMNDMMIDFDEGNDENEIEMQIVTANDFQTTDFCQRESVTIESAHL